MEGAHDDKAHARKSGCCKLPRAITLQQLNLMQKAVYLRDGELITNRSRGGSARSAERLINRSETACSEEITRAMREEKVYLRERKGTNSEIPHNIGNERK